MNKKKIGLSAGTGSLTGAATAAMVNKYRQSANSTDIGNRITSRVASLKHGDLGEKISSLNPKGVISFGKKVIKNADLQNDLIKHAGAGALAGAAAGTALYKARQKLKKRKELKQQNKQKQLENQKQKEQQHLHHLQKNYHKNFQRNAT